MSLSLQDLKTTAVGLPLSERAELVHYLLQSFEQAEDGAATAWLALAERRMAAVQDGQVVGIPAAQVLESMRRPRE